MAFCHPGAPPSPSPAPREAIPTDRPFTMVREALDRTGQVWVSNVGVLFSFGVRLVGATGQGLAELGSKGGMVRITKLTLRQIFGTLSRGALDVLLLGVVLGLGLRTAVEQVGILRPIFESVFMPIFIRGGLPLGLAVLVAARSGAPVSLQLAIRPLTHGIEDPYGNGRDLNAQVLPHLVAVPITTALFFLVGQLFLMIGYTFDGSTLHWPLAVDYYTTFLTYVVAGSWRAMLFGFVIAFVACALGVEAAERRPSNLAEAKLHDAAWESTVTSVFICTSVTAVLWILI